MQSKTFRENRFHPEQLAQALEPTLECLSCGDSVTRLGDDPHCGVCERCGEQTVTPAGDLTITGQHDEPNFDGSVTLTLNARDESDREFTYSIEVGDGDPELRAVIIAGQRVTPDDYYWDADALWTGAVEQRVSEYEAERDDFYKPLFGGDEA